MSKIKRPWRLETTSGGPWHVCATYSTVERATEEWPTWDHIYRVNLPRRHHVWRVVHRDAYKLASGALHSSLALVRIDDGWGLYGLPAGAQEPMSRRYG